MDREEREKEGGHAGMLIYYIKQVSYSNWSLLTHPTDLYSIYYTGGKGEGEGR